jgi:Icc-related predicted phosphoesterase
MGSVELSSQGPILTDNPTPLMRILHCSDLHASTAHLAWVSRACRCFDLVVLSGDLLDLNLHCPIGEQVDRVLAHLRTIEAPLALCSGNHDSLAGAGSRLENASWLNEARRKNVWIDGDSFEMGGHAIRCVPWNGALPEAGPDDFWVIHSPPDEAPTGIARGGAGFGSFEFGELCRSKRGPKFALSGHVHDPQSWHARIGRTLSLNPGFPEGTTQPNRIEIDLARGVVVRERASGEADFLRLEQ